MSPQTTYVNIKEFITVKTKKGTMFLHLIYKLQQTI